MLEKIKQFCNRNIERKIATVMIPIVCGIIIVALSIISHIYSTDLIYSIEERTQYAVETAKINMDHYVSSVKNTLNVLSNNSSVKALTMMNMNHIDYESYLYNNRSIKSLINSYELQNDYVQNLIIVGLNGYQYDYLNMQTKNIMEEDWFTEYIDMDELGFQYILPHEMTYMKGISQKVISILLPVKSAGVIQGYIIADIGIDNLLKIPDVVEKEGTMSTYFVNKDMTYAYNFILGENRSCKDEVFLKLLSDQENKFDIIGNNFVAYSKMTTNGWYIVTVYDFEDIVRSVRTIQQIEILMIIVCCIAICMVSHLVAGFIRKPIDDIVERIQTVESQNFEMVIPDYRNQPGELVLIRNQFEEMIQQINELVNKVYLDEIYQKEMEYEQLVNQINPHFLYNVFQLIQSKAVLSENFEINDIVVSLSKLLRYNMSNNQKIVTLREECSYVDNYLMLYQKRFSEKFSYEISMDEKLARYPIIKFLIQPIVENCIKHGFKNRKEDGIIRLTVSEDDGKIKIMVWDNGNGLSKEKIEELMAYIKSPQKEDDRSIGLRNTYQRLRLTYGEMADMTIRSSEQEYTQISCFIPMKEVENV